MDNSTSPNCVKIRAEVVRGHQVASGTNSDPRFPGGTVRMQLSARLSRLLPGAMTISRTGLSPAGLRHPFHGARHHSFFLAA